MTMILSVFGFNVGYWQWRNLRFEPSGAKLSWRGPTGHCREAYQSKCRKILGNYSESLDMVDVYTRQKHTSKKVKKQRIKEY